MAEPILGFGTQLWIDRGAGYERIVKLLEIGEFGGTAPDVDITTHDSSSGYREFLRGLIDAGDIALSGIWTGDPTQVHMWDDIEGGPQTGNLPYRVVLPQARGQFDFEGYLKSIRIRPNMDGRLEFNGSAKISGKPLFTINPSTGLTTPYFVVHDNGADTADVIPNPAGNIYDYIVDVDTTATSVTITPTAAAGVIEVNDAVVATGVASGAIALGAAQSITIVTIMVTEVSKTPVEYVLRVARA